MVQYLTVIMALTETDHLKQRILRVKGKIPPGHYGTYMRKMFPNKYEVGTAGEHRLKNTYRLRAHHVDVIEDLEALAAHLKKERSEGRKVKKLKNPASSVVGRPKKKVVSRQEAARGG